MEKEIPTLRRIDQDATGIAIWLGGWFACISAFIALMALLYGVLMDTIL